MAAKLWGPMLTGIAQGFGDYQTQQEDLAYTRQARMQQLQGGQLDNQTKSQENQARQQQLESASLTHQFAVQGLQDASQAGDASAQQAAPGAPSPAASAGTTPSSSFKPVGPMSVQQLSQLDQKYGVPSGTAYGLMAAESNGNPNAVSPKGAQGLFQVEPTTAAQPGYGLKPFNPKDPDAAMAYFAKLYQKAGGDTTKALQYWNAGPGGNPDNPETKGFIPRVQKNAQQFAQAQQLEQSKQQPTPADQLQVREDAGVQTPVTVYQQVGKAQQQQIQAAVAAGQRAQQAGYPELAQQFFGQAQKLQDQQVDLQKKTLDVQKEANDQTAKLANGVTDQASYNNLREQIKQNPAMQNATAGLNLTGDYNQDRNKIRTLADRSETLKDQHELQLKQADLDLKQAKERREQQQADAPKLAQQAAIAADTARQKQQTSQGIPFAPSLAASAPKGATTAQVENAQKRVQAMNAQYDKMNAPSVAGAKGVMDQAAQAFVAVGGISAPGGAVKVGDGASVSTGGLYNNAADKAGNWALTSSQQEYNKLTASMVQSMQLLSGANGGARSASTAAMYANYAKAKPNVSMSPQANAVVAHGLYVGAAAQFQMNQFLDEYRSANPDASVQSGVLQWHRYEQAAGPTMLYDPATKTMVPNTALLPALEDGTPNPNYKDPKKFFSQGNF